MIFDIKDVKSTDFTIPFLTAMSLAGLQGGCWRLSHLLYLSFWGFGTLPKGTLSVSGDVLTPPPTNTCHVLSALGLEPRTLLLLSPVLWASSPLHNMQVTLMQNYLLGEQ